MKSRGKQNLWASPIRRFIPLKSRDGAEVAFPAG
jgi:hypothetical protein